MPEHKIMLRADVGDFAGEKETKSNTGLQFNLTQGKYMFTISML